MILLQKTAKRELRLTIHLTGQEDLIKDGDNVRVRVAFLVSRT